MLKTTRGLLIVAVCMSLALNADMKQLTIKVTPLLAHAPAWIRVTLHIERVPENRNLEWSCDGINMYTSQTIPLEGEFSQATFQRDMKSVPSGDYECRAALERVGAKLLYANPARFTVIGFE